MRRQDRSVDARPVELAQITNFALQVALIALWRSWGIVPDAVIGHSAGEVATAYAAGILDLRSALSVAFHRGRLLDRFNGTGRMLAAGLPADAAASAIEPWRDRVTVAAVNSPSSVTLSGEAEALEQIAAALEGQQIFHRFLPVALPYHSPAMETIRDEFESVLADLSPAPPRVPMVSTVTGSWADPDGFRAPYWYRNTRHAVRFADGIGVLMDGGFEFFLEIGPHPVLAFSIAECLSHASRQGSLLASHRRRRTRRDAPLARCVIREGKERELARGLSLRRIARFAARLSVATRALVARSGP
jgi:hybrid polyketide synthase / nonribosomal peptide synthetase FtdB